MAQYVLSPEALRDLSELQSFLTERESSERSFIVLARLHRAMSSLADYPGIGRRRDDLTGSPLCFPVSSWLIFYSVRPDRTGIEIARIIDMRRDINALLRRDG